MSENNSTLSPEEVDALRAQLALISSKLDANVSTSSETPIVAVNENVVEEEVKKTSPNTSDTTGISNKKIVSIGVFGIAFAIAFAVLVHFVIHPAILVRNAQNELDAMAANWGAMVVRNSQLADFEAANIIPGSNPNQQALSMDGIAPSASSITFYNGIEEIANRKKVDLFIDIASQHSRDLILQNQQMFIGLVESGMIELNITILPGNHAFSFLAIEAMANMSFAAPDLAWDYLVSILHLSMINFATTDRNEPPIEAPAEVLASDLALNASRLLNAEILTKDIIQSGSFSSWALSGWELPGLQRTQLLPQILVDNFPLDEDSINFNNSIELQSAILTS